MVGPSRGLRQRGFTLLEMLVTLVVLSLLVIGLTGGVRTGLRLWDAQASRVSDTAELDAAARTLRLLLTEIPVKPPAENATDAPNAIGIAGKRDSLAFIGAMPDGLGGTRLAEIVLERRARRLVLAWRPHWHEKEIDPPPAMSEIPLVANVERLEFAYWGETEPGRPPAWLAGWEGPALPELVRLRLGFAKSDARHWPDLIAAPRLWQPGK